MTVGQKALLTLFLIFCALGLLLIAQAASVGKLRIIACDVGQGDGLLIITPKGREILVDGGPGRKIEECLASYMPFWDRTIEMVLNTHPQQDHLEGLVGVLANYKVKMIATTGIVNDTQLFREWQKAILGEGAKIYTPRAGDRLVLDQMQGSTLTADILWPTEDKLAEWKSSPPKDVNESSIVFRLNYGPPAGGFCAYFTGDLPKELFADLASQGEALRGCQLLKVAHHGSKTGTSEEILNKVSPRLAIISVGKNNRFGHPTKEVLDLLVSKGVKTVRTDTNGVIEVDSDGKSYGVKTEK